VDPEDTIARPKNAIANSKDIIAKAEDIIAKSYDPNATFDYGIANLEFNIWYSVPSILN
jgi:hypothetical protein